ncbi:hypothetical protein KJ636_06045 [Patescibacteria group bacterium]|nr:hypothetical protein [Patescibacteria group bacterium]MBU4481720.1 hypothetical protein [Patescibacteria group bacterium]
MSFLFLLSFFWFIRETKAILFWLYLWQLKEYHIGRFIDHFRTAKGKSLLINKLILLKIIIFFIFLSQIFLGSSLNIGSGIFLEIYPPDFPFYRTILEILVSSAFLILLILYFLEGIRALRDFFRKKLRLPVFTKKVIVLVSAALFLEILILVIAFRFIGWEIFWLAFWLLIFDIFTPAIISAIVLIFQPLAILGRNQIIKKAKKKREEFKNLLVVGITGSYGKTSTKEFLAAILSEKYRVLKTLEHQNSEVGISQCILNDLKEEHEIFVCEMGAYNRGGIKLLCDIVKPKIGILTGINEQHMATFGSQENIIKTKFELIESLPPDGVSFFNAKNKYCLALYQRTQIKKFLYGQDVKLTGMENIEGAKAVAQELGMNEEEISRGCKRIENKFAGIQLKKGINDLNIIDATYSANPDGVIYHLEYLKTFPGPEGKPSASYGVNKKVIVMPCLIELGSASKEVHKRIGKKIGEVCSLAIITTKDRFKELKEGFIEGGGKEGNILFLENPKIIFEKIKSFCKNGDVMLLEGRLPKKLIELLIKL